MAETGERVAELRGLAERLGFEVHDASLYDRALTHASSLVDGKRNSLDYESLEFLGDAVLGLAIAHHLFETHPDHSPGEYSRMRAGLVNRQCVARVGQALDIVPLIRLGRGEELSGGRARISLVADCMEALIGAVYLDNGYESAHRFVVRVFSDEVAVADTAKCYGDFKSRLQNYCQGHRIALPRFDVIRAEGPDHQKEFEVEVVVREKPIGRGVGSTKKEAEQMAARAALIYEGQDVQTG
jgi:ribonuclease III